MKYPLARAEEAKKVIKISGGGARPLGGPRLLGPFDPSIIRRNGKKTSKKTEKVQEDPVSLKKKTGGPSTTRSLRTIDHSQDRKNDEQRKHVDSGGSRSSQ